jgi:glycosyltransferase involved in cell wall biosynthesis
MSCKGIFVNSNWTRDSIIRDYNIDPRKVYVVGVGVSLPVKSLLKRNYDNHNIIFIGREWVHKGGPLLLGAFSLIRNKFPDATLTIIGCNPIIREKNVKILGVLDKKIDSERKIIEDALSGAGVLCVPSIFEAYGICFLESQLYGIPPITFEGEGRSDSIKNGETGILLKERTSEAISNAITDLFSNPDKASKMGQAGNDFVKNNLTWDHVAERVLNVIKENAKE